MVSKKKEVNEETKKKMRLIRNILLLIGIPLLIAGGILFGNTFVNFSFETAGNAFIGISLLAAGGFMTMGGLYMTVLINQRGITKYFIEEGGMAMGTADEEALDGYGRIIRKGTGAMAKGLDDAGGIRISLDNDTKEKIMVKCRECGTLNDENAQFCDQCGKLL